MTLESSYPRIAALSSQVVFGSLPISSILKFASRRYCPFLFKITFSYLIFLVAIVAGFFPSIRVSSWLLFVCMKMLFSKLKLRDTKQVNGSWTPEAVMLLHSVLPYHLPILVPFWF